MTTGMSTIMRLVIAVIYTTPKYIAVNKNTWYKKNTAIMISKNQGPNFSFITFPPFVRQ